MLPSPGDDPGVGCIVRAKKEINPTFVGLISFWNPATSYSPGRFQPCCFDPGNSHSRGLRPLPEIPDAPPRCFAHRARSAPVPQGAHGWKPKPSTMLHLAEDSLGAALSRAFFPMLYRPQGAHDWKPNQVQCCIWLKTARKQYSVRFQNKKHPIFMGCFLFWNPATSYSPGPSPAKYHRR